jgi:DNA-binding SARP family transcriptional activator
VALRCFGGFALTVGGEEIDLDALRPRARALLRVLAVHQGRDVHRERLVDQLWSSTDLATGTRGLQVAMSSVRQVLRRAGLDGNDVVRRRGDAYRLTLPAGSRIDVLDFDRLVRAAAPHLRQGRPGEAVRSLSQALSLYVADLLPEDGPAEWVVPERERLRLLAATAAADLAVAQRELGELREAQVAARRSAELDPVQDAAWRLLAELYEEADDFSAAARARQDQARAHAQLVDGRAGGIS